MKRIVTFSVEADGRKRVQSISAPVDETKIDTLSDNMGFIDSGYTDPQPIEGKKVALFYNAETQLVEVEYSDIEFEDLDPINQIKYLKAEKEALKAENDQLKADVQLTQDAVMELYEGMIMLSGMEVQ